MTSNRRKRRLSRYDGRYAQSPVPEFVDPVRAGDQFDEFNIEHDALGREFDLWEPPPLEDVIFQRELQRALNRALGTLRPREELYLRLRYGIPFEDRRSAQHQNRDRDHVTTIHIESPQTINEIAQKFDSVPDRVRLVIARGLRRLSHRSRRLRSVLYPNEEFTAPKSASGR